MPRLTRMRTKRIHSKPRQFTIGSDTHKTFPTNSVRTSKYTKLNFLPKAILLQFKRPANIYFLVAAILQCIDVLSSLSPASAVAPLIIVITLSVIREGIEDIPRQKSDTKVNSSMATVMERNGSLKQVKWSHLKVGDLLLIKDDEEFPADIVLLKSSHENGMAFIETANLDGEKNLKPKFALPETACYFEGDTIKNHHIFDCDIYAQTPDPSIYRFEGAFVNEQKFKTALLAKQFMLRASRLKNVEWVVGVVVYTGHDTKIMRNAEKSKTKVSRVEHMMNKMILGILFIQLILCSVVAIWNRIWNGQYRADNWYLPQTEGVNEEGFYTFLSYFLLTNTMIPISLIVTMEIVKFIQAKWIQFDEDMYSKEKEKGCKVFCSSINEELGLVDYIFTDKTGTLTSNEMVFKNFVVGREVYGEDQPRAIASTADLDANPNLRQDYQDDESGLVKGKFMDKRLQDVLMADASDSFDFSILGEDRHPVLSLNNQRDLVMEFMQSVATCHECIADKDKDGNLRYQGQSQDEVRLVETASNCGFKFIGGSIDMVKVDILGTPKEFKILQIFEFTSDRKRMSVIVRDGTTIKMYTKGADNVIMDRLRKDVEQPWKEPVNGRLEEYSRQGYRTLLFAMKTMSEAEYKTMKEALDEVADAEDREERIYKIADSFEKDLYLMGCTAVEDKLQDNVPKVIHDLLKADIKIWMLTGDKLETAENIAHSCRLITGDMNVMRCHGKTPEEVALKLESNREDYNLCIQEGRKKAFIVEGEALTYILQNPQMKELFTQLVLYCDAVVCCRAAPKQKAEMVRMIKERTGKVTLAIGDGANDVNMIQAANIGVGVYGHEGVQAIQASDYAIPEFQALWRLVLVHGRWSYIRIAEMILYFFYKNMLFTLIQFYFAWKCAYSAQTYYDDWYVSFYNLLFTAFPLGVKACLDKDIDYKIRLPKKQVTKEQCYIVDQRLKNLQPYLYNENKRHPIFTYTNFALWVIEGVVMSVLLFIWSIEGVAGHLINDDGIPGELWFTSITTYTAVILVVSVKLCVQTRYWNIFFVLTMAILSIGSYFVWTVIYDNLGNSFKAAHTVGQNYQSVLFYSFFIFFVGFELLLDLSRAFLKSAYRPNFTDILRQQVKKEMKMRRKTNDIRPLPLTAVTPINDGHTVLEMQKNSRNYQPEDNKDLNTVDPTKNESRLA